MDYPPEIAALIKEWRLSEVYNKKELNSRYSERIKDVPDDAIKNLLSAQYLQLEAYAVA